MKNFTTNNPILNIVLGVVLIGLALTATFFTSWLEEAIVYIIAALIILVSLYRFYIDFKRTTDKNATIILVVELLIALGIGIYLFTQEPTANASRMVGFVLYLRGFTYLLTLQLLKISGSFKRFLIIIALMTLGAYMLFSGIQGEEYLQYGVFGVVSLYGLLLLFAGIQILRSRPSNEKRPKVENTSNAKDTKKETPKTKTPEKTVEKEPSDKSAKTKKASTKDSSKKK